MKFTYLDADQLDELRALLAASEERANTVLGELGPQIRRAEKAFALRESALVLPSKIPGHQFVDFERPTIAEFCAIVADIRGSTKHLRQAISADYSLVERVYFESSLLLPVLARVLTFFDASAIEFLGDGLLGLLVVDPEAQDESTKKAVRAGVSSIEAVQELLNPILQKYALPGLLLGVGVSRSRGIVSVVGDPNGSAAPNLFGECVFRASKLSKGSNEVFIDDVVRSVYAEGSARIKYSFKKKTGFDFDAYSVAISES